MSFLKFTVLENGKKFSVSHMTEPECAAIEECVNALVPDNHWRSDSIWLEPDLCLFGEDEEEEEPDYGLLRCFTHNPHPKNGSLLESRIPHEVPKDLLEKLAGKTFRVYPRQLGLSPWADKVEIVFEKHSPTDAHVKGIAASVLIAAALKQ